MAALLPAVAAASRDLQEPRTSRKLSMKDLFGAGEGASSTYKATTALAKVGEALAALFLIDCDGPKPPLWPDWGNSCCSPVASAMVGVGKSA